MYITFQNWSFQTYNLTLTFSGR